MASNSTPSAHDINYLVGMFEQSRFAETETLARTMTAQHPYFGFGWKALSVALQQQGKLDDSLTAIRKAVMLLPHDAEVYNNFGALLLEQGDLIEAEKQCRKSVSLQPGFISAQANLALILKDLGHLEQSEALCRQALHIDPKYHEACNTLGLVLFKQSRFKESSEVLKLALIRSPNNCKYHLNLGLSLAACGDFDAGDASLRKSLTLLCAQLDSNPCYSPNQTVPSFSSQFARQVLFDAHERLEKAQIPFFLSSGTLLGIVRDGDTMPYDKDLDIGFLWETDRELVVHSLCHDGLFEDYRAAYHSKQDREIYIPLRYTTGLALDLFFHQPNKNNFICGFNTPLRITSKPKRFNLKQFSWYGRNWLIPDDTDRYFTDYYGENWKHPDPGFDTILSSQCQTPESRRGRWCFGCHKLFSRMKNCEWSRAIRYCEQLLALREDSTIQDITVWLKRKLEHHEG
ncbi:MAG: tetratricopeptide repeat protein [Magnetococcales bacterium]|nr:tetratricopeptide repeat protein [Magnetococcales bacterium]